MSLLRECFRNLQEWKSLYESEGIEVIETAGGSVCLWDIKFLFEQRHRLPRQQRRAIELFLYENMPEKVAAVAMGVSATNPIGMYASLGLEKLVMWLNDGTFGRFQSQDGSR